MLNFKILKEHNNYLLALLLLLMVLGCSKEEPGIDDFGMIIGEWEGYDRTLVFMDGSKEVMPTDFCEGNILQFYEDRRLHWVDFVRETPVSCIENNDTKPIGRWERISNGKYIFTLLNASDDSENRIVPKLVIFNFNGAETMEIQYSELYDGAPEGASYYYLTLFRK